MHETTPLLLPAPLPARRESWDWTEGQIAEWAGIQWQTLAGGEIRARVACLEEFEFHFPHLEATDEEALALVERNIDEGDWHRAQQRAEERYDADCRAARAEDLADDLRSEGEG